MTRIVLINPAYFAPDEARTKMADHFEAISGGNMYFHPFEPPLGLAGLAAVLADHGHHVRLVDMPGEALTAEGLDRILADESPDLVGLTAMTPTLAVALSLAGRVKAVLPFVPVVCGGVHPTVAPGDLLASPHVDQVVRGEGEQALVEMARALAAGVAPEPRDIPGLCGKAPDGTVRVVGKAPVTRDFDSLPRPDYRSFPAERYIEYTTCLRRMRGLSMMVTRGCPYRCSFCAVAQTMGRKWRARNPEGAADDMMGLCREFQLDGVWFKDSVFNLDPRWTRRFADALVARDNPYRFQINTRVDLVRPDDMARLREAGLAQVDLGIESGSARSLATLNKGITVDQTREAVALLKGMGLSVSGFFMLGIPGETEKDILQTLDLERELDLSAASVSLFVPLPGSALYDQMLADGRLDPAHTDFSGHHFTETRTSYCDVPIDALRALAARAGHGGTRAAGP